MSKINRERIAEEAKARRERIKAFMEQEPAVPFKHIMMLEGMSERSCREIIRELDAEFSIGYAQKQARAKTSDYPPGLTNATQRLRGKLGDYVYMLRQRGGNHDELTRNEVGPRIGLNPREQRRAEEAPFNHDWTLSQIERLARELGRDPRELLIECLSN